MKLNFIGFLFLLTHISSAQLPELAFGKRSIENEINAVKAQLKNKPDQSFYLLNLARNYYQLDNYKEAENYYRKVIQQPICSSLDFKALAISLRNNGKTQLAEEFSKIYTERTGVSTFSSLWESNNSEVGTELKRIHPQTIIYGNAKANGSIQLCQKGTCIIPLSNVESLENSEQLNFPKETLNHIGNYTEANTPNSFYYSMRKEDNTFGIFYVERKKNKWSKAKELVLGEPSANYAFPLYVNGMLYFSSDKSGGNGYYDIYEAKVSKHKVVSVLNLGKDINTDKNEICPSIVNGSFAFSSNGYPGKGGYDVYTTDWTFQTVTTLPLAINSKFNDLAVLPSPSNNTVVIRDNGFDIGIYSSTTVNSIAKTSEEIQTTDTLLTESSGSYYLKCKVLSADAKPIKDVRVLFSKSYVAQGHFKSTQSDGSFGINLPEETQTWMVEAFKPGYEMNKFELDLKTLDNKPLIIMLNEVKTMVNAGQKKEPQITVTKHIDPQPREIKEEPKPFEPTTAAHPTKPIETTNDPVISSSSSNYYIIYGSSPTKSVAEGYYEKWLPQLPNIEIIKSEKKGAYRVGTYAGTTHGEAMKAYYAAKKIYANVWILRPEIQ